jgi:lysophospholipase L1-like esterase
MSCYTRSEQSNRWEDVIKKFEEEDKNIPPPKNSVLFIGSSSIRMWKTLKTDFPNVSSINRGFGGSEFTDLVYFAHRIIIPYKPKLIIVYSGDNDIAREKTPQQTFQDFKNFVSAVKKEIPEVRIGVIAIKPSLQRWHLVKKMRATNKLMETYCNTDNRLEFIDIDSPMLGTDGKPKSELFLDDGLHLNRKGYDIWKEKVMPVIQKHYKNED